MPSILSVESKICFNQHRLQTTIKQNIAKCGVGFGREKQIKIKIRYGTANEVTYLFLEHSDVECCEKF
jgi:hypothetical protein